MKRLGFLAVLAWLPLTVLAQSEIGDGTRQGLALPDVAEGSASISAPFFFDVPAGVRSFSVGLTDIGANDRNIDLLLKADDPFSFEGEVSFDSLINASDYYAISQSPEDVIVVQDSTSPAAPGRRWYIAFIIFGGEGGEVGLSLDFNRGEPAAASFLIDFENSNGNEDCDVAPWNDTTAFTPVGGNSATTLGEARRNAMIEAASIVAAELFSPVPIRVEACWESGEVQGDAVAVANGRPAFAAANTPGLSKQDVLYPKSISERLAGTDFCGLDPGGSTGCEESDLVIFFNVDVDGGVLGDTRWYYGLSSQGGSSNDLDFVQVAAHELSHGLGYTTLIDEDGSLNTGGQGQTLSDSFLERLVDVRSGTATPLLDLASDADRAAALVSGNGLEWTGLESSISSLNTRATQGDSYIRMYAPNPYEGGSSTTHLSLDYCDLMIPRGVEGCEEGFRSLGLTRAMLNEVGWSPGPVDPPFLGQMFDQARTGHGFEFQEGGVIDGRTSYVLTFYSFDNSGRAEWYQSQGFMDNGVFFGDREIFRSVFGTENGLEEFTFDSGRSPPQQPASGHRGHVVLSFNDPENHPACNDGVNRSSADQLAVLQWIINNDVQEWCVEPIAPAAARPTTDIAGLYFAPSDIGWGFSVENILQGDGTTLLFVLAYVYADDGTPVWFFGLASDFVPGQPIDVEMFQRDAFARTQTGSLDDVDDRSAGTLTLTINSDGTGTADIDVAYREGGANAGDWVRDVNISRLTVGR
ncbi:MAG: hypothetical protein R3200_14715 [Xanthomonadales bacterium]|nr:hypothetical protein [Xanthomonadales bacterium]